MHPITALQTEYSLWSRDVETEILATRRELDIGFVAYSPLGRGFLTGKIKILTDLEENDWRRNLPRFQDKNFEYNLTILEKMEDIAGDKHCTVAQLALAWLLSQGNDIIPIAGTKHIAYLEEDAEALAVNLDKNDLNRIDQTAPLGAAHGMRYPEQRMHLVNG